MDLRDSSSIVAVLQAVKPDIVINCAANSSIQSCEDNQEEAELLNNVLMWRLLVSFHCLSANAPVGAVVSIGKVSVVYSAFYSEL